VERGTLSRGFEASAESLGSLKGRQKGPDLNGKRAREWKPFEKVLAGERGSALTKSVTLQRKGLSLC